MTYLDYLLQKLWEEGGEVGQEASKSILFGLDDFDPNTPGISNRAKLNFELNDFFAILVELETHGFVFDISEKLVEAKRLKIRKYYKFHKDRKQ